MRLVVCTLNRAIWKNSMCIMKYHVCDKYVNVCIKSIPNSWQASFLDNM